MDINWDFINSFVTFIVGFIAFFIYFLSKNHERESAAMIIVMDIRNAESVVQSILEKGSVDIFTKSVMSENNWAKYKHLFARKFSQDDFAAFNRFFDSCVEMSDARTRIREVFYTSINEKARIFQNKIYSIDDVMSSEGQEKQKTYLQQINANCPIFEPSEPQERMIRNLQSMGKLSSTTAYEKLKKIANEKT